MVEIQKPILPTSAFHRWLGSVLHPCHYTIQGGISELGLSRGENKNCEVIHDEFGLHSLDNISKILWVKCTYHISIYQVERCQFTGDDKNDMRG